MASSRAREDLCSLLSMLTGWVNTLVGGQQSGARGFMFFIVNVDRLVNTLVGGQQSGARGFMFFIVNVDRLGKFSCGWPVVGSKRIYVLYC